MPTIALAVNTGDKEYGIPSSITPWSSHFRGVLKSPDVYDCAAGRGLLNTWSSSLPTVVRIRIDQCVVACAAGVTDARVGESVGSDHLSAIYDLSIGLTRER